MHCKWQYYDMMGQRPTLYYKTAPRYSSLFGFIMTILASVLILFCGIYFFISFVKGDELTVIVSKDTKKKDSVMDITHNIFFYQIINEEGLLVVPRLIESVPTLWTINSEESEVELLKETQCNNEINGMDQEHNSLINFDISSYKCLTKKDSSKVELELGYTPYKNSYINIYIAKCRNSTENNNH